MPQFKTTRQIRHSAENMYALVADVERYPEFVPLCQSLVVHKREDKGDHQLLLTDMTVAYGPMQETMTCTVKLDRTGFEISTEALKGPLSQMRNVWRFVRLSETSCEVEFYIHYEFRTKVLQLLVGGLFDKVFRKFSEAFEERADKVYGP